MSEGGAGTGDLFGVLVTYRRPDQLRISLERIAEQRYRLRRLVVVDNDPSRNNELAVQRLVETGITADYIGAPENLGPAGGFSLGMAEIQRLAREDDWIILLDDDDPIPGDTLLERLRDAAESLLAADPRTAAIGSRGARFDWRRARPVVVGDGKYDQTIKVDHVHGGFFPLYRVKAVREVGTFLDCLFFGFEELEYGLRLSRAGYSIYVYGPLTREIEVELGHVPPLRRPRFLLEEPGWRRYYGLRNLSYILIANGRRRTAVRIALVRGVGKPLLNMFLSPTAAMRHLKLNLSAVADAWRGRMGRTLDPPSSAV